jgi:hypothetical protein
MQGRGLPRPGYFSFVTCTVFLLSPANCGGKRAAILMRPQAQFDLAVRLREGDATIGEVFSFMSGLYFRGKLAYARAFANPPATVRGIHVIVPGLGLQSPDLPVDLVTLRTIAQIPVDLADARYLAPLQQHLARLHDSLGPADRVVLLGSLATPKYLQPLGEAFGARLRYPAEFVGLGDMSRGSVLLRRAAEGRELEYVALAAGRTKGSAA